MSTVTLEVADLTEGLAAFREAWISDRAEDGARIGFASPELLWKVLSAKRWELLRAMTGQRPMALRKAARRVGRDVKAVHSDVHALVAAGIVRRTPDGRFEFPYDTVHVSFMLRTALASNTRAAMEDVMHANLTASLSRRTRLRRR